jgi:S1-C subfamily serine protease
MLAKEGDRLTSGGWPRLAWVSYRLGGLQAVAPEGPASVASGSAAASAGAPSASAVAAPSGAPSAGASAGPAPSASAKPAPGTEVNAAELFKKLAPAVVTLSIKGARSEGGGTGFLIDSSGTVVTNHHVIEDAVGCTVKTLSGATYEDVWLLTDEATSDLALLKIDLAKPKEGTPPDFAPVTLGDSQEVQVGEPVFVIGNPLGLEHTLTTGIVSARRTYEGKKWIQMSAPISPGNSGGPVFDGKGRAIGVATAVIHGYGRAQNLNLAVPVDQVKQLVKSDYPNKRKLGSGGGAGGSW